MDSSGRLAKRTRFASGFLSKLFGSISVLAIAILTSATFAHASVTVTVVSPKSGANAGSPIFYEAYATSPSCSHGISAMRIYTAPGVSAYTVDGAHIETFIPLKVGTYSTVVQAWDNCGGVAKKTVDVTVNSDAGVSVFLPTSKTPGTPVHVAASAQNPACAAGISAIRIYAANAVAPYTIDSNQLNAFVNLRPENYDLTVQAWDNCGHVYKAPLTETATAQPAGYLYAVNETNVSQFDISNGVVTNPNGSGNPPTFNAAKLALSMAVDPGGWFAWVFTTSGIYGYQIDQSNGNLWTMPGSPFPLNGTPINEPPGYLYPEPNAIAVDPNGNFLFVVYNVSNTMVCYQINRSTGAITPTATVAGSGAMFAVTADFTGQYVYALNQNFDSAAIWGWQINQNNGALTAIPGSPYTIASESYGGGLSSTILPSGPPDQPVLYASLEGNPPGYWAGYALNYGTGALTALSGSPYYADGTGYPILADNQGIWVWSLGGFPSNPPEYVWDWGSIESDGALNMGPPDTDVGTQVVWDFVEDGTGEYLYSGGVNCPTSNTCVGAVSSWTVSNTGPSPLNSPLVSPGGLVLGVGAVPKRGD